MKHIRTCFHTLLDPGLDFRVRLFNSGDRRHGRQPDYGLLQPFYGGMA